MTTLEAISSQPSEDRTMRLPCVSRPGAVFSGLLALAATPALAVDFIRDVQPIFEGKCVRCHGPEKQKSGYRLDAKEIALTGGEAHAPNIVPGRSADSPLVKFVSGLDEEMRMPPRGEQLTAAEVATIRAWIDGGASWPQSASATIANPVDWWSLKPIPTKVQASPGGVSPLDSMISAKLASMGLTLSPEADARTLCRRLYFDLIGLPPTPEEIEKFERSAPSEAAYEALVDTLLASPRHGERWARHWLDVVHYGDTHGYDKDQPRNAAWPYRDYVIRALNSDKPYARFVQEQIAGDVLFPGTRDGIEALGFIAAGPWDLIGHKELPESKIDGKIARHLDRDDMVANTIGTFCSVTVHCAQCHNHKFDPISQEDYYSLQAVFAALDRATTLYYTDDAIQARFVALREKQTRIANEIAAIEKPLRIQAGTRLTALTQRIEGASARQGGNSRPDFGYHSAIANSQETTKWVQVDLGRRVTIDRVVLLPAYDDYNRIGAGFGFPVRFKIEASDDPEFRTGPTLFWRRHEETFMRDFPNPKLRPFETRGAPDDGIAGRYVRVTATKLAPRKGDYIFSLAELQVFDASGANVALGAQVAANDSIEAPPRWRRANLTDGVAPVSTSQSEKAALIAEREALIDSFADPATKTRRARLLHQQSAVEKQLNDLPPPGTTFAGVVHTGSGNFRGTGADGGKPRPIFLLARGQVTQPQQELGPGALSALQFAPARFATGSESERRAALARWITHPENPLTWRSIVNRVWQYHFGRGLVDTPNDFGRMGGLPIHPELLDWLAADFRDSGGSLKRLHKLIVMSAVYRQSSGVRNPQAETLDAENSLLWRQNRRKLEAEAVRDSVLAVSGKLDLAMGGPGWQDFLIERPQHSPHYEYAAASPEDAKTWRRSVYRFIVRSSMQPWLTTLDCADPSIRVDKRNESVSAPQALALMNNGFMIVQAREFARRVEREAEEDRRAQARHAHRLAVGRPPSEDELTRLTSFAHDHGLANLCRLILNLNEFVFVD